MEEVEERLLHSRSPGARKSALSTSNWRLFASRRGSLVSTSRSHSSRACQNNAAGKTGDAEVIQHLPALMVRNALDRLGVNAQLLLQDKIGDIFSHDLTFIHDLMPLLLRVWDGSQPELHTNAVFINLLVQAMSPNVQYFDCAADYCTHFLL
jgi:hypothetical protein